MDILNQFGVKPLLLAAQVVNFLILLFILKKFLYKPILKVLDERKKRIEDSLKNAESIEKRLAEAEEQSEKILARALTEERKILNDTNAVATQILEDTNRAAEQILIKAAADAKRLVELEKEILMREVRTNLSGLVALVFEKVIGKKITTKDQKILIEKEIKNLS